VDRVMCHGPRSPAAYLRRSAARPLRRSHVHALSVARRRLVRSTVRRPASSLVAASCYSAIPAERAQRRAGHPKLSSDSFLTPGLSCSPVFVLTDRQSRAPMREACAARPARYRARSVRPSRDQYRRAHLGHRVLARRRASATCSTYAGPTSIESTRASTRLPTTRLNIGASQRKGQLVPCRIKNGTASHTARRGVRSQRDSTTPRCPRIAERL